MDQGRVSVEGIMISGNRKDLSQVLPLFDAEYSS